MSKPKSLSYSVTNNAIAVTPCGYAPFGNKSQVNKLMEMHSKVCSICKDAKKIDSLNFGHVGETARREDIDREALNLVKRMTDDKNKE